MALKSLQAESRGSTVQRERSRPPQPVGTGRELFAMMRMHVSEAKAAASAMLADMEAEQA